MRVSSVDDVVVVIVDDVVDLRVDHFSSISSLHAASSHSFRSQWQYTRTHTHTHTDAYSLPVTYTVLCLDFMITFYGKFCELKRAKRTNTFLAWWVLERVPHGFRRSASPPSARSSLPACASFSDAWRTLHRTPITTLDIIWVSCKHKKGDKWSNQHSRSTLSSSFFLHHSGVRFRRYAARTLSIGSSFKFVHMNETHSRRPSADGTETFL